MSRYIKKINTKMGEYRFLFLTELTCEVMHC